MFAGPSQVILNGLVTLGDFLMCIRLMKEQCHAWIHFRWPTASELSIQPLSLRNVLWRHQNNTKPTKGQCVIEGPSKCFLSLTNSPSVRKYLLKWKTLQILSYRQHLLHTHIPAYEYSFTTNENNIELSVKGLGGGLTDDGKFNVHICS